MERRLFLGGSLTGGIVVAHRPAAAIPTRLRNLAPETDVYVEREQPGQPHRGKVLAAIAPHCDDISLFAAGTVLKLVKEGYSGVLIRTTNDEMKGTGATSGEAILNNERDNAEVARRLGLKKVFDLRYRSRRLDESCCVEMRARLVFLLRLMKVDTVICDDPWAHYEENPDHRLTASCVEAACLMAADQYGYSEHLEAGLGPHTVRERYYYARGHQAVNRVVDISAVFDGKLDVNVANASLGPAGENGARLRARLAAEGRSLPVLGDNDETANRAYIRQFVLREDAELGQRYGLRYAEPFHYIGPKESMLEEYIDKNAVRL